MLDKGEYLGNFIISRENAKENPDLTWTVYQNDKVRALLNRTIREGKRLFCRVDEIGIKEAYEATVNTTVTRVEKQLSHPIMLQFRFGIMFYDSAKRIIWGSDEVANWLSNGYVPDYIDQRTSQITGGIDFISLMEPWRPNASVSVMTNKFNEQLRSPRWEKAGFSIRVTERVENYPTVVELSINSNNFAFIPPQAEYYQPWFAWYGETTEVWGFPTWKADPGYYPIVRPLTDPERLGTDIIIQGTLPVWHMKDFNTNTIVEVPLIEQTPINIVDRTIFWTHSDLTFNNLNLTPVSGMCFNNTITTYNNTEGTIYELIQLSPNPKLEFFVMNKDETRGQVMLKDFHIQLSFYGLSHDFKPKQMKYLGNFVISLENTKINRAAQTMEVYQNDKVRALLDRCHSKGKQLYAKIDQIAFESIQRSNYSVTITEWEYVNGEKKDKPRFNETITVPTSLADAGLWQAVNNALNQLPEQQRCKYTFSWVNRQLVITVEGRTTNFVTREELHWTILFSDDLREDYQVEKITSELPHSRYHTIISSIISEDDETFTTTFMDDVTLLVHMGRNHTFTTNQMYFYHPDLVGENMNSEPATISCQYPGLNRYSQEQYYYIRAVSAPTYIHFFYWSQAWKVDPLGKVRWLDKHEKTLYIPANFNVVISYYEGD